MGFKGLSNSSIARFAARSDAVASGGGSSSKSLDKTQVISIDQLRNADQKACAAPFFRSIIGNAQFQNGVKSAVAQSRSTPPRSYGLPESETAFTYGPRLIGSGYSTTSPLTSYDNDSVKRDMGSVRRYSYLRNVNPSVYAHTHTPNGEPILSGHDPNKPGDIQFSDSNHIPIIAYDYARNLYLCHMDRR